MIRVRRLSSGHGSTPGGGSIADEVRVRSDPRVRLAADAAQPSPARRLALLARLLRFAMPATLVMVLSGMSLLVDTYFVTSLGRAALAGVSLVFPVYLMLAMAFGGGIGIGASVVVSVRLGRGDRAAAQRAIGAAFALAVGLAVLFALAFLIAGRTAFSRVTTSPEILDAALRFGRPLLLGSPIMAVSLTMMNLLRSEKRVNEAAALIVVGGTVNAILNPVLIHGLGGAPAMGVAGAGAATVLGFAVSACLGATFFGGPGRLSLRPSRLRVAAADALEIVRIALPTIGLYVATNATFLCLTSLWARFGADALASYGLATRLEYLMALAVYGLGGAIVTLGGEAWGGGRRPEFVRVCWTCAGCAFAAATTLSALLLLAPTGWFELFRASPGTVSAGARYLRVVGVGYPFYVLALTLNYGYQTIARAWAPVVWSAVRGFAVALPVAALAVTVGRSPDVAAAGIAVSFVLQGVMSAALFPAAVRSAQRAPRGVPRAVAPSPAARPAPADEAPTLETLRLRPTQVSPYPLWYSLRWPWYFRWPSTRNHTGIGKVPPAFARAGVPSQATVRICAIGDIMVMQGDRVPVLDPELVSLFSSADVIVGCCEAPIGRPRCDPAAEHHFLFNMPAEYLRGIVLQGRAPPDRWYLSVANNHAGDVGPSGLPATVRCLTDIGVRPIGHRLDGDAPVRVIDVHGLRLGISAWTRWQNVVEDGVWRAADVAAVRWRDLRARHELDGLIGSAHWEYEWQHFPRADTRALAQRLAWAGFDLILGSHTHTLQPFEWMGDALCVYSLGNFCSGIGPAWPARMCSALTLELGTRGEHRGKVVRYELHPFVQIDDGAHVALVPVRAAPSPLRERVVERVAKIFACSGESSARPGSGGHR